MSKIKNLAARPILDSSGKWTIEVALTLVSGLRTLAAVPRGISSGKYEAVYLNPAAAAKIVKNRLTPALRGLDVTKLPLIDERMIRIDGTKNKSKLGGNAMLGISLACARAGALVQKIPLWKHLNRLADGKKITGFPLLFIVMIEGGKHGRGNLKFQEYLAIPKTKKIEEAVEIGTRMYAAVGKYLEGRIGNSACGIGDEGAFSPTLASDLEPFKIFQKIATTLKWGKKLGLGLDAAASEIAINPRRLFAFYRQAMSRYNLFYLEDVFDETDFDNFCLLNNAYGQKVWITGDDLTVTNLHRMQKAFDKRCINAIVIKPNQIGTLTETLAAVNKARAFGWKVIVSHRGGETNDDFIADLAYGVGADGFKLGAPARGERIAKYNRLLAIEKEH